MDKSTLSGYGWIIIVTLILAVMLALATPFGTYVGDGVVNVANSFVKSADNAMDEDNIDTMKSQWEGKLDYSAVTDTGNKLNHKGIIPEGGVYVRYTKRDITCNACGFNNRDFSCYCGDAGQVEEFRYTAGNAFPEPQYLDTYKYGDYMYVYSADYSNAPYMHIVTAQFYNASYDGWLVTTRLEEDDGSDFGYMLKKTTYGTILESVAEKPVTSMNWMFYQNTSLTTAPTVPSSVTKMNSTFYACTSLTAAPVIPNNVTDMYYAFAYCTSLTTAPTIPSSVTDMQYTFNNCTLLTGTITINANPTFYNNCFGLDSTGKPITLTGSSTMLQTLANTSTNRTITIQ